jgi:hypothetical protein
MLFRARKTQKTFKLRNYPQNKDIALSLASNLKEMFVIIPKTWSKKDADRILNYKKFENCNVVLI